MGKIFEHDFWQLATYENGRTPVLLTEEEYNRAKACEEACLGIDDPVAFVAERSGWMTLGVGDGAGKLFVHGDSASIHACREKLFALEKLRAEADLLRVSLAAENDRLSRNDLLERRNAELVSALKRCALVLSGEEMAKSSLVRALESARDVLAKIERGA